jgi:galactose-1-phosphate uridylyltransferase
MSVATIEFAKTTVVSRFGDPRRNFALADFPVEIRTCPLSGQKTRLTPQRIKGKNLREDAWPDVAGAVAASREDCPFCPATLAARACKLDAGRFGCERVVRGDAFLFPNLAPYGPYSAVTVIGAEHYVETGQYDPARYLDAFLASREYLGKVRAIDPSVAYAAITQNHLPASGGTLVHPHLQVQADAVGPTYCVNLRQWQRDAGARYGRPFWPLLADVESARGERFIGATGRWRWLTMWAPQGQLEVWGVADEPATIAAFADDVAREMVDGLLRVQRWHRRRNRNSFNLAVYFFEPEETALRLTCRIFARNNWAPFARNDRSFYETTLGEMVFDQSPERWAAEARPEFR